MTVDSKRVRADDWSLLGEGSTPAYWSKIKVKHVATFSGGGTPDRHNSHFWGGEIPWISPKDMKGETVSDSEEKITEKGLLGSATSLIEPGRVLMVVRSGILKHTIPVAINLVGVSLNQDMKAFRMEQNRCDPLFFLRWVQGHNHVLLAFWTKQGATVESIEQERVANTWFRLPPIEEQRDIARLLDSQTSTIDTLIEKKTRFIELLKEKRAAVITHAVTKGLDPDVPRKDSGVEWLGDVPEHWGLERMKYGLTEKATKKNPDLPPGAISYGRVVAKDAEKITPETRATYQEVLAGEYLINPINLNYDLVSLRTALSDMDVCVSPAYIVLRAVPKKVDPGFGNYVLHVFDVRHMKTLGAGVRQTITFKDIGQCVWPLPPMYEQIAIAHFLDRETTRIDTLISLTERSIHLLKEKRSALITAAVTGKIDVRAAA